MKKVFSFIVPVLFAIAACSCGGKEAGTPTQDGTVEVTPGTLTCPAQESVLTLDVKASGPFQAYAADGIDWVSVDPAYSKESEAKVTVKVAENFT